MNYSHTHCINN